MINDKNPMRLDKTYKRNIAHQLGKRDTLSDDEYCNMLRDYTIDRQKWQLDTSFIRLIETGTEVAYKSLDEYRLKRHTYQERYKKRFSGSDRRVLERTNSAWQVATFIKLIKPVVFMITAVVAFLYVLGTGSWVPYDEEYLRWSGRLPAKVETAQIDEPTSDRPEDVATAIAQQETAQQQLEDMRKPFDRYLGYVTYISATVLFVSLANLLIRSMRKKKQAETQQVIVSIQQKPPE